jgi:NRAMP (natural resistance-associated macrophage protein)-like metal ion transporter
MTAPAKNSAWKRWRINILLFLAVLGPGFITANVDNDAGGILTYSQAGAHYGYKLLWTMIPITLALIVVQEMCARMGAVTGKGLSDLIREEFGLRMTFVMMILLVVVNWTNVIAEFTGIAGSLQLFGISKFISVPTCALAVWLLVVKGNYKSIEKVFLVASVIYIAYVIAGVMSRPDWHTAMIETVKLPERSIWRDSDYVYMVIGVIGTTIAPWMQFYLQASIVDKGITVRQYKASRLDVIVGSFFTDIVAWFIIVVCAATLYTHGMRNINVPSDAAEAMKPLASNYAYILFAAGLFNASFFAASILPLSTAYTVCEGLGFESGLDRSFKQAPFFYWFYTFLIVAGGATVLLPRFPMVTVTILSQVLDGVLLPFVLIFMLRLINKKELMGKHTNSLWFNWVAWATTLIVIALTVMMLWMPQTDSHTVIMASRIVAVAMSAITVLYLLKISLDRRLS